MYDPGREICSLPLSHQWLVIDTAAHSESTLYSAIPEQRAACCCGGQPRHRRQELRPRAPQLWMWAWERNVQSLPPKVFFLLVRDEALGYCSQYLDYHVYVTILQKDSLKASIIAEQSTFANSALWKLFKAVAWRCKAETSVIIPCCCKIKMHKAGFHKSNQTHPSVDLLRDAPVT